MRRRSGRGCRPPGGEGPPRGALEAGARVRVEVNVDRVCQDFGGEVAGCGERGCRGPEGRGRRGGAGRAARGWFCGGTPPGPRGAGTGRWRARSSDRCPRRRRGAGGAVWSPEGRWRRGVVPGGCGPRRGVGRRARWTADSRGGVHFGRRWRKLSPEALPRGALPGHAPGGRTPPRSSVGPKWRISLDQGASAANLRAHIPA